MIRHIVFFKFKPEIAEEQKNKLVEDLKTLKKKIPLIQRLEVEFDIGKKPNSYDLALNTDFNTWEDVEKYSIHPDHVTVVVFIKQICEDVCKIDYEVND
jgi:hypothetical protein